MKSLTTKALLILIMALALVLTGCGTKSADAFTIGVTQIVEHPSLDTIRRGIYDALEAEGYVDGENLNITYMNAQGNMDTTLTIANNFKDQNFDVAVGITTPSAQALFNVLDTTPIIYSAVTDPLAAGLEGQGITGVSDMTPIQKQFDLLVELLPEAKTVGMVYNSGELNSEVQVDIAKEVASQMGLELELMAITSSNEVKSALDALLGKVDALYVHKDNIVASAFPVVIETANSYEVPVIGAVSDYVDQGAVATDGPSEYQIGYETGVMIAKVLSGTEVNTIEPSLVENTERVFNEEALKKFELKINE